MVSKLQLCLCLSLVYSILSADPSCNIINQNIQNTNLSICIIQGDFQVTNRNSAEKLITMNVASNHIIQGLLAEDKEIYYLPQKIENINYKLIKILKVTNSSLKEISSANMKMFPNLQYLDLSWNYLAILDENLFQNNKNLSSIILNNNKIFLINPSTFNGPTALKSLILDNNLCMSSNSNTHQDVQNVITLSHSTCWINSTIWTSTNESVACRLSIAKLIKSTIHLSTKTLNIEDYFKNYDKDTFKKCKSGFQTKVESNLMDLMNTTNLIYDKIDEVESKLDEIRDPKGKRNLNSTILGLGEDIKELRGNMSAILEGINGKISEITKNTQDLKEDVEKFGSLDGKITNLSQNLSITLQNSVKIINENVDGKFSNLGSANKNFGLSINSLQNTVKNLSSDINLHKNDFNISLQKIQEIIKHNSSNLESKLHDLIRKDDFIQRINRTDEFLSKLITESASKTELIFESQNNSSDKTYIVFLVTFNVILIIFLIISITYIIVIKKSLNNLNNSNQEPPKYARISSSRHFSVSQPQPFYESTALPNPEDEPVYAITTDENQNEDPIYEMEELGHNDKHVSRFNPSNDACMYDTSHWGESSNYVGVDSNLVITDDNGTLTNNDEDFYAEITVPMNTDDVRNEQADNSQIYAVICKPNK